MFAHFGGRFGGDAFRYVPAVLVPAVLSFIGVAVYTRLFPPTPYGHYALVMAVAGISISALGGWLQQAVLRYLPRYRQDNTLGAFMGKLGGVMGLEVVVLAVVMALLYPVLGVGKSEYARFYFPGVVLVLSWLVFLVYNAAFQAKLQSAQYAKYQIAQAVIRLVFSLFLVFLVRHDVVSLVIGSAISYAILVVPMGFQLGAARPANRSQILDPEFIKLVTSYGLPLVAWMVSGTLLELSHRFIINLYKGPEQVGIFAANYNVGMIVVGCVAGPILFAAESLIVNAWEGKDRPRIQGIIAALSRYLLLLVLPIGCYVAVYARVIASLVFGEEFREGFAVIPFVVFGLILWNFGMYGHKIIKLVEKTKVMFLLVFICAIANIVLNFVLVPFYGYLGAAIASLVSYALYPVMVYFAAKRYMPWLIPWGSVARIGVASLVAAAIWFVTRPMEVSSLGDWLQILASSLGGVFAYAGTLFVLREVRGYEKEAAGRLVARFVGKGVR